MSDLNEHEQWDAIKDWWKENGRMIIIVVSLVSITIAGVKYWQNTQSVNAQRASVLYDQLLNNAFGADIPNTAFTSLANELQENYSKTPYASNAALFQAKAAIEQDDFKTAQEQLNWVVKHGKESNLRQIARLRLARVLLAEDQPDQAMDKLSKVENDSYIPAINLVKGDIYLAKDNKSAARKAYLDALNALPENQPMRQYLQMQVDQLSDNS